jgi:hypothetical protein
MGDKLVLLLATSPCRQYRLLFVAAAKIAHRLSDGAKNQGKGARPSTNLLADAHFQTLVIGVAVEELPKWGNLYMSSMVRRTL